MADNTQIYPKGYVYGINPNEENDVRLKDLADVDAKTPADGDALVFNILKNAWEPKKIEGSEPGPGGTSNYNELTHKPSINGVELVGNKTSQDLHIAGGSGTDDYDQLQNRPSINGHTLTGNKTAEELGIETGTDNYTELSNKPQINGHTLTGNKTAEDLGITDTDDYDELTSRPSINGVTLTGNKTTADLGIETGTDDYTDLTNKPSINGRTLNGNKTTVDLELTDSRTIFASSSHYPGGTWQNIPVTVGHLLGVNIFKGGIQLTTAYMKREAFSQTTIKTSFKKGYGDELDIEVNISVDIVTGNLQSITTTFMYPKGYNTELIPTDDDFVFTVTDLGASAAATASDPIQIVNGDVRLKIDNTLGIDSDGNLSVVGGGGGTGTTNYNDLLNRPQINGHTLTGNQTPADLDIIEGTLNYNELNNRPQINGVLLSGNKTAADLGISSGKIYTHTWNNVTYNMLLQNWPDTSDSGIFTITAHPYYSTSVDQDEFKGIFSDTTSYPQDFKLIGYNNRGDTITIKRDTNSQSFFIVKVEIYATSEPDWHTTSGLITSAKITNFNEIVPYNSLEAYQETIAAGDTPHAWPLYNKCFVRIGIAYENRYNITQHLGVEGFYNPGSPMLLDFSGALSAHGNGVVHGYAEFFRDTANNTFSGGRFIYIQTPDTIRDYNNLRITTVDTDDIITDTTLNDYYTKSEVYSKIQADSRFKQDDGSGIVKGTVTFNASVDLTWPSNNVLVHAVDAYMNDYYGTYTGSIVAGTQVITLITSGTSHERVVTISKDVQTNIINTSACGVIDIYKTTGSWITPDIEITGLEYIPIVNASNYYTKSEVYNKSQTYSKSEVDSKLAQTKVIQATELQQNTPATAFKPGTDPFVMEPTHTVYDDGTTQYPVFKFYATLYKDAQSNENYFYFALPTGYKLPTVNGVDNILYIAELNATIQYATRGYTLVNKSEHVGWICPDTLVASKISDSSVPNDQFKITIANGATPPAQALFANVSMAIALEEEF